MIEIIEKISEEYDGETNLLHMISYEANLLKSQFQLNLRDKMYFDFYKISKSIKRVSKRLSNLH